MQDGAKPHVTKVKVTLDQKEKAFHNSWRDWSWNSPELNPIEHILRFLNDSIFEGQKSRIREDLINKI